MARSIKILMSCIAACAASSASASDMGSSSSATMTITVTIPPFLAALAAQKDGAVGLWTVTDDKNALMIKTPDLIVAGEDTEAAIYHGQAMLFSLAPEAGSGLQIRMNGATVDNGLRRQSYTVSASPTSPAAAKEPARIVVTAI